LYRAKILSHKTDQGITAQDIEDNTYLKLLSRSVKDTPFIFLETTEELADESLSSYSRYKHSKDEYSGNQIVLEEFCKWYVEESPKKNYAFTNIFVASLTKELMLLRKGQSNIQEFKKCLEHYKELANSAGITLRIIARDYFKLRDRILDFEWKFCI
jgi:hypothetical protein